MSELDRENIIKALEWCIQAPDCENCEYKYEHKHPIDVCSIRSDALALIKELYEDLHATRTELTRVQGDTVRKMQERLKAEAITIQDHTGKLGLVVLVNDIDQLNEDIALKCKQENGEKNEEYWKGKLSAFKQIRAYIDAELKKKYTEDKQRKEDEGK